MLRKRWFISGLVSAVILGAISSFGLSVEEIDDVFSFAEVQYKNATDSLDLKKGMPRNAQPDGSWRQMPIRDWTSGFFPGCLWLIYENNPQDEWLKEAKKWTAPLEPLKTHDSLHDIGFMVYCSYGNGYRLTKDPEYKEIILTTADTLATRFRPSAQAIQSWGSIHQKDIKSYRVIIDNMMNLEMLLWAAKNGGDAKLREVAIAHADTTMKNHFRADGSSYHGLVYDAATGKVKRKQTHQGYADESMWARGQGWAIYGYTMMVRETGDKAYLDRAEKAAAIYLKRLPEDGIPRWDFDAPDDLPQKDASAAALTSSAFIELYEITQKTIYLEQADKTLTELSSDRYLAKTGDYQCLLLHSVGHMKKNSEVDVNINYADYYFLEALSRLKKIKQ